MEIPASGLIYGPWTRTLELDEESSNGQESSSDLGRLGFDRAR
jgi:hypothetical protein